MKRILISPYSREAKVYPYWQRLIDLLAKKYIVMQLGTTGEAGFNGADRIFNLTMSDIEKLVLDVGFFVAVDNFLPHMAHGLGVKGVVLFGPSDPNIFGHDTNVNLLKSREYLRKEQFQYYGGYVWEHKDKGWLYPEEVYTIVNDILCDKEAKEANDKADTVNRTEDKKKGGASVCPRKKKSGGGRILYTRRKNA